MCIMFIIYVPVLVCVRCDVQCQRRQKNIKIIVSRKNKGNRIVKNKSCVKLNTSRRRENER